MLDFSNIIPQFLKSHHIDGSSKFVIACSGGVDSMVLSELFVHAGLKPTLAHCNFMLRGAEADADQDFVRTYAQAKGLPFFTTNFDTAAYAKEKGVSIQMAARDLRYGYFEEIIQNHNIDYLCTAHHADDSLETILLNLGRGTGLAGLTGMKPKRDSILRPLLSFTKSEIIELENALQLSWREDASNAKTDYQRNYIRHKVVPVFKENFPGFDKGFKATTKQLNDDGKLFQTLLNEKLSSLLTTEGNQQKIAIADLENIEGHSSLLHHWLKTHGSFDLKAILQTMQNESGRVFASGKNELLVDRDFLILRKVQDSHKDCYSLQENETELTEPFSLCIKEISAEELEIPKAKNCAALDKDKLQFPLTIRKWKKGDSFFPLGMQNKKKLSDFFIDQKLTLFEKEEVWLLLSGNDIVWVINHRIDDRYKVSNTTKTAYFARLK